MNAPTETRLVVHRVADPRRLIHAARALSALEDDLRFLLGNAVPLDPATLEFAAQRYRTSRQLLLELFDDATDAADRDVGLPELPDGATAAHLMVVLSQATRFVGVEESFPSLLAQSAVHSREVAVGLAADPSGTGKGEGPGYI